MCDIFCEITQLVMTYLRKSSCSHLNDDEQTDSSTHLGWISIHASHHIHDGLANGDDHSKHWKPLTGFEMPWTWSGVCKLPDDDSLLTFLCSIEEGSVLWCVANFNDFSSSQQLHYQAWCDNRRDTQLHQRTWKKIFKLGQQESRHAFKCFI